MNVSSKEEPMSLADKLYVLKEKMMGKDSPLKSEAKKTFIEFADWLKNESGIEERALNTGGTMPMFTLPAVGGGSFDMAAELKKQPVVVNFFRGEW
jgi:hypothetical protein